MYKFTRRERGAVSVFLVIILVPCMLVASIFVDVGRVYLSKSMAESAADMALNSLMTNYDYDLNDWYGMVASCQSIDEFYEASIQCYTSALKSQNLTDEEISTLVGQFAAMIGADSEVSDFLRVSETEGNASSIKAVEGANLGNSTMLKSQIVDFMKYRAPLSLTETVIDKIRSDDIPGISDVVDSEKNKPLIDSKEDFYEADSKLLEDSYRTYKYLYDNYSSADPTPTNSLLTDTTAAMLSYRESYREMNKLMITNLYNTSSLVIFNRAKVPLNQYEYHKSNTECYSRVSDGTYYIDGDDLQAQFTDISNKIIAFDNAKRDFTNAINNNGVSYSDANTIQYWKHAFDSYSTSVGSGRDYRTDLSQKADDMIKSYAILKGMMECTAGESMPENYTDTYNSYKSEVENRQAKYLVDGVTDSGDDYLILVNRLEDISNNNYLNVSSDTLTLSDGSTFSGKLSTIASDLSDKRNTLQKYSDVLNVVIYGDSSRDIVSLATLKDDAGNYRTELDDWKNQAEGTDTDMAEQDQRDISNLESDDIGGNITKESVIELENRLKNIKSQIDAVISAIDAFSYGGTSVMSITDYSQFKNAASSVITEADINERPTDAALNSYAETTFATLFTPAGGTGDAVVDINTADDYNLELDVGYETVAIPNIYTFWHNQFHGADEGQLAQYKSDKNSSKNKQDELKDAATNKANPHPDAAEIARELDTINATVGNSDLFSSVISLIGNVAGGNIESIRDNLYVSTYMLDMFSYSTIDNEGRYDLLKKDDYDMTSLNASNYAEKYGSKDAEWASTDPKNYYNKSLTNKMLNANAAYGCELEYILYGKTNDENIKAAYSQIYEIRYVLNLVSAFQHFWSEGNATANAISLIASTISAATSKIVPAELVKIVLIALLTVFETCNDMNRLEAGFPAELYKTEAGQWQISLEYEGSSEVEMGSISDMMNSLQERFNVGFRNNCENGIRYSDYLCLFIVCGMQSGKGESMTLRCADIIQSNMRKVTSNDGYSLKNAKTYFELDSQLRVDPLLITLPIYSQYNEAYDSTNTDWCTYNIKTIRGY